MNKGGGDGEHIPEFHRIRTSTTCTRLEHVTAVPQIVDDVKVQDTCMERNIIKHGLVTTEHNIHH